MNEMTIIDKSESLTKLCELILNSEIKIIGLDFEGEFNLHRYGIHLCLVQIAFNENIYIIDPVLIENLAPLKPILESTEIEKVIYACNIDVRLLKLTHNINIKNIFDIRAAAMILRLQETSLSPLINNYLGVSMEKDKKCQKSNWNKRPLSQEQLEYASNDVLYLIPLRNALQSQLTNLKLLRPFTSTCKRLEKEIFTEKENKYTKITNYYLLNKNEKIYIKHYYNAREEAAKKLNFPPFWVLGKDDLIKLAKSPPSTKEEWENKTNLAAKATPSIDIFIEATRLAEEEIKSK